MHFCNLKQFLRPTDFEIWTAKWSKTTHPPQSERCSDFEIRCKKWMLPNILHKILNNKCHTNFHIIMVLFLLHLYSFCFSYVKSLGSVPRQISGFPTAWKIMENLENEKCIFQTWKNHGIWKKAKIMEKSWNFKISIWKNHGKKFRRSAHSIQCWHIV